MVSIGSSACEWLPSECKDEHFQAFSLLAPSESLQRDQLIGPGTHHSRSRGKKSGFQPWQHLFLHARWVWVCYLCVCSLCYHPDPQWCTFWHMKSTVAYKFRSDVGSGYSACTLLFSTNLWATSQK